jgi:hypothetical protein
MAGEKCAGAATACELCGGVAAVHCEADSAFLCASCDAKVHGANFLASRHLRRRLVAVDDDEDPGSADSDSSSSSCVSTADSCAAPAHRHRATPGQGRTENKNEPVSLSKSHNFFTYIWGCHTLQMNET